MAENILARFILPPTQCCPYNPSINQVTQRYEIPNVAPVEVENEVPRFVAGVSVLAYLVRLTKE